MAELRIDCAASSQPAKDQTQREIIAQKPIPSSSIGRKNLGIDYVTSKDKTQDNLFHKVQSRPYEAHLFESTGREDKTQTDFISPCLFSNFKQTGFEPPTFRWPVQSIKRAGLCILIYFFPLPWI